MRSPPVSDRTDSVSVSQFFEALEKRIELKVLSGDTGLERQLRSHRIQKLGLGLAGFVDYLHKDRVQFIGRSEVGYLATLTSERAGAAFEEVLACDLSCLLVTTGLELKEEFLEIARRRSVPILVDPRSQFPGDFGNDLLSGTLSCSDPLCACQPGRCLRARRAAEGGVRCWEKRMCPRSGAQGTSDYCR